MFLSPKVADVYGLPEDFDASTFVGLELEAVTFTSNTIHIAFGGQHSVTTTGNLRYRLDRTADLRNDVLPAMESCLPALLGRSVVRVEVRRPGDLLLHLEGGGMLVVEDHDEHYESYTVKTPAGELFV